MAGELAGDPWIHTNVYSLALASVIYTDGTLKERLIGQVRNILWVGDPNPTPGIPGLLYKPFFLVDSPVSRAVTNIYALCLVYDLLYDEFTQTEQDEIKNVIVSDLKHADGIRDFVYNPYQYLYGSNHWGKAAEALAVAAITLSGNPVYPEASADLESVKGKLLTEQNSYLTSDFF